MRYSRASMQPSSERGLVRVLGVQEPRAFGERPPFDHLLHERLPEPTAAMLLEHVDVGEVHGGQPDGRDRPAEADLTGVPAEFQSVLRQALSRSPARRPSIEQLLMLLLGHSDGPTIALHITVGWRTRAKH